MAFKFEQLQIWHRAVELSNEIDLIVRDFPKLEHYSLATQMKRATDSVALNIAEGCTGQSTNEFIRFLNMALRSAVEVVSALHLALKRKNIIETKFREIYNQYSDLCKMITKFREALKS